MNKLRVTKVHFVLLTLIIFGIFLMVSFVVAAESSSGTSIADDILNKLNALLEKALNKEGSNTNIDFWEKGGLFSKILIFILVALIIYSITPFIPFLNGEGKGANYIAIGISAVVAILATFWLTSMEISAILVSYGALGIVLTAIVPFFAILAITKRLYEEKHILFAKFLWAAFILVTLFRLITAEDISAGVKWFYLGILLVGLAMLLWEHRLLYFAFKQQISSFSTQLKEDVIAKLMGKASVLSEQINDTRDDTVRKNLIAQFNKIAQQLREKGQKFDNWRG